ncbi:MAG TPA: hypothetical protein VHU80_17825 [Polyangiaceae bacterium]|nr:hypothetical protein [Polyangiaceae bacterium]
MSPISSLGFQLNPNGKFEARHLDPKEEAPKLTIDQSATRKLTMEAKPKLAISGQTPALAAGAAKTETPKAGSAAEGAPQKKTDPKLEKVAHEFESIFLRNLLKPLEEAGSMGKKSGSVSSGSGVYGSMMVGALADSASAGGGIGLAHLVLEALTRGAAGQKTTK